MVRNIAIVSTIVVGVAVLGFLYFKPQTASNKPLVQTPIETASVAGVLTVAEPTSTPSATPKPVAKKPQPTATPLTDCIGPDGKHSQASKADCDNLNAFWKANTPSVNNTGGSNSQPANENNSNSTTTPTPTSVSSTPTPTAIPDGVTVNSTSFNVTLSRANAVSGLVYGPGLVITSINANGVSLYNNGPTQGQGFYIGSAGMPIGGTVTSPTYINVNKPNGTYTGSVTVQYSKGGSVYTNAQVVSYSITLTD